MSKGCFIVIGRELPIYYLRNMFQQVSIFARVARVLVAVISSGSRILPMKVAVTATLPSM